VGIVPFGLDVPKNPVFMRVSGLGTFEQPFLQHFCNTFFQKRVLQQMK